MHTHHTYRGLLLIVALVLSAGFLCAAHVAFAVGGNTIIGLTVTNDAVPPTVPTALNATPVSSSQIDLTWTASTDNVAIAGYVVRRGGTIVATTSSTTAYSSTGLTPSTLYSFTVEAFDTSLNYSGQSGSAGATTLAGGGPGPGDTTPPTVSSLSPVHNATGVSTSTILTINFSEPIRKLSGSMRIRQLSTDAIIETIPVASTQVSIAGSAANITLSVLLVEATQYYVEVDASMFDDQAGNPFAGFSGNATWRFTTVDQTSPIISGIFVSVSTTSAILNWNTNETAVGTVRWGITTDYNDGMLVEGAYNTTHVNLLSGLTAATTYFYQIVAQDTSGNTATGTGMFTTSALPPPPDTTPPANVSGLSATPSTSDIALSWTNPTDIDFDVVRIMRSTLGYPATPSDGVLIYQGPGVSVSDTGVSASVTYYYTVFSRDITGNYSSGAIISATVPSVPPPPPPPGDGGGGGGGTGLTPTTTPPIVITPPTPATTTTPFDNFPPIGNLPSGFRALSLDDFTIIEVGEPDRNIPIIRNIAKLDGDKSFKMQLDYNKLPEVLKTIAITIKNPKGAEFSFIMKGDPVQGFYEAHIDALKDVGKYPFTVSILDISNRSAKIMTGILDVTLSHKPEPETLTEAIAQSIDTIETPVKNISPITTPVGVAIGASEIVLVTTNIRSFYDLYMFVLKLLGLIVGVFRKRKNEPWGVVYDSVTKRPLDPAYVIAQDLAAKRGAGEAITDLDGRYGFILKPGEYVIVANKTHYRFPSKQLQGRAKDEFYDNLYFGEQFGVKEGQVAQYNIPLDPIEFDWNEFAKNKDQVFKVYSRKERIRFIIFNTLFFIGFIFSGFAVYFDPSTLNIVMVVVYGGMLIFQIMWKRRRRITQVRGRDGNPLSFALIKLFLSGTDTMVKKVVADDRGRFYLLVPPGVYTITVEEKLPDGTYRQVLHSQPKELKKGVLTEDLVIG